MATKKMETIKFPNSDDVYEITDKNAVHSPINNGPVRQVLQIRENDENVEYTLKSNPDVWKAIDKNVIHSPIDSGIVKQVGVVRENNGALEYALKSNPDVWKAIGGGKIEFVPCRFVKDPNSDSRYNIKLQDKLLTSKDAPNIIGILTKSLIQAIAEDKGFIAYNNFFKIHDDTSVIFQEIDLSTQPLSLKKEILFGSVDFNYDTYIDNLPLFVDASLRYLDGNYINLILDGNRSYLIKYKS